MSTSEVSITSPERRGQADFRFMRARLSRWIAFGLGSGLARVAPGTVGTLAAWALFALAQTWLAGLAGPAGLAGLAGPTGFVIVLIAFGIGIWACGRTSEDLGVDDHGAIVWDEIVAFWALLLLVPGSFGSQFAAFLLFRFFDIVKPPPIRQADRKIKGGFGVMLDDLLAAAMSFVCLWVWQSI